MSNSNRTETDSDPTDAGSSRTGRWWYWLTRDEELRKLLKGIILLGFTLFFVLFFSYMIFGILIDPESWIIQKIQANFAATIGIAFAAMSALFIVLLLQYSVGHIRLKGLGFEFEGASAPTVLWLICFLGIVAGMKILWGA